jgi:hypothetical protein
VARRLAKITFAFGNVERFGKSLPYNAALYVILLALLLLQPGRDSLATPAEPVEAEPVEAEPVEAPLFTDVSAQAGLTANRRGTDKSIGQAFGDYDNDGWLDLYVTDSAGPNTLYHNNGDGTFSVSPLNSQVILPSKHSSGAGFIDYDNDGWRDLYVLNWGENVLYRNEGGTAFIDVTETAAIAGGSANSKTASWGDYDQDGYLDLYVANWACYPECGRPFTGESDRLYHNNGIANAVGTFTDVTRILGSKTAGAGFVASFTDYDNDGDLDLYLVNDEFINPIGNVLWRNDGPGCEEWCFVDVAAEAGANTRLMGMGLAPADYDNDGDQDFYFSNAGPMALLQNQGDGTFVDMAQPAGVELSLGIGWGAVFFDYNNDGWRDLYVAVAEGTDGGDMGNPLFHNDGNGGFTEVGAQSAVGNPGHTMGVAYGDYNNDGWVDLLIGNYDEGYFLYRNDTAAASQNRWLTLELTGGGPVNRDAVGTKVKVTTADGRSQMQEIISGSSLGAGNSLALHFGLGSMDTADIQIIWPDGLTQSFQGVAANQYYRLSYPANPQTLEQQRLALYGPQPQQQPSEPSFYPSNLQLVLAALLFSLIVVALVWLWRR